MFGEQRIRLLRRQWPNATMLSQELYAMMDDDSPVSSGPIVVNNPTGGPGIRMLLDTPLPGYDPTNPSDPAIDLQLGKGTGSNGTEPPPWLQLDQPQLGPDASVQFVPAGDGGLIIQGPSLQYRPDPDTAPTDIGQGGGGGGGSSGNRVYPGKILSGSGSTYTVLTYPHGITLAGIPRQVKILQIDAAEVIPANTWLTVYESDLDYYAQPPVWA